MLYFLCKVTFLVHIISTLPATCDEIATNVQEQFFKKLCMQEEIGTHVEQLTEQLKSYLINAEVSLFYSSNRISRTYPRINILNVKVYSTHVPRYVSTYIYVLVVKFCEIHD